MELSTYAQTGAVCRATYDSGSIKVHNATTTAFAMFEQSESEYQRQCAQSTTVVDNRSQWTTLQAYNQQEPTNTSEDVNTINTSHQQTRTFADRPGNFRDAIKGLLQVIRAKTGNP